MEKYGTTPEELEDAEPKMTNMTRRYSTERGLVEGVKAAAEWVTFRKGTLLVSCESEFCRGIKCGQAALFGEGEPPTERYLFQLYLDGVHDLQLSESWLVGFFLGMSDALLRGRKLPPNLGDASIGRLVETPRGTRVVFAKRRQA